MDALVIGRPNSGKSLLTLNFARYLGVTEVVPDALAGSSRRRRQGIDQMRHERVSPVAHRSLDPLRIRLDLGGPTLFLYDTAGIAEGIHPDLAVRQAMVATLEQILAAQVILHVMDASLGASLAEAFPGVLDDQLVNLCEDLCPSLILANKVDQDPREVGVRRIRQRYPRHAVVPTSGLTHRGFREIKHFLKRCADGLA